jgi:Asp/Glu/hydantoin racemase
VQSLLFIHTVQPLIEVFNDLSARMLPDAQVMHILDEPLLKGVQQRGSLTTADADRLKSHVVAAEQVGVRAALVTCSTISPLVDQIIDEVLIPTMKIDEAMIDRAVKTGSRICVLATAASTLQPTRTALEQRAVQESRQVQVETVLVENALELLLQGRGDEHDRLMIEAMEQIPASVDLIVLAQASMARVLDVLPESAGGPLVLSSPHLALEDMKGLLAEKQ